MKESRHIPTCPTCWSCGMQSEGGHFCSACGKIQPLGPEGEDYFELLDCPREMNLEHDALRKNFYKLSRKFHPDYFQNLSRKERDFSLERSAALNRAYQTLRDPLRRARYVLELEGYQGAHTEPPGDLLMEVLEVQEGLEEIRSLQDPEERADVEANVLRLQTELKERETRIVREIEILFDAWDTRPNERPTTAARIFTLMDTRTYLLRALTTIEENLNRNHV